MFDLKTKLYHIFGRNSIVRIKLDFMVLYKSLGICFQMGLGINMLYGFLGGILGNRDPIKGMRRLPRVRPLGRGVTILLVLELTIFKPSFEFCRLVVLINCNNMLPKLNNCLFL